MIIDAREILLDLQRRADMRETEEKRYTELAEKIAEKLANKFAEVLEKRLHENTKSPEFKGEKVMEIDGLRYSQLYKLVNDMRKAEIELNRKSDKYWKTINPTRKKQTSLMAQKERASEWFGKCELEFEKYIKEHSIDGVFRLTNTDEFMAIYNAKKENKDVK